MRNTHIKKEMAIAAVLLCLFLAACAGSDEQPFPLGGEINSPSFTGTAYLEVMIPNDEVYHFPQTNHITFEPGARSSWHSHGGSADTEFAHIAVNTNPELTGLQWFDRISAEEYGQLPTEK